MKSLAIRLVVAFFTFFLGLSTNMLLSPLGFEATSNGIAEQEILRVERLYIEAHLAHDAAALDRVLADEFTIGTRRRHTNKTERLALLADPNFAFESIDTENVRVEVTGDTAKVTGEATLKARHGAREYPTARYRFIRRYEKRQGNWQIVAVRVRH